MMLLVMMMGAVLAALVCAALTADRRLYADREGNVVEADDPNRATLIVGQGAAIPPDLAERYNLRAGPDGKIVSGEAAASADTGQAAPDAESGADAAGDAAAPAEATGDDAGAAAAGKFKADTLSPAEAREKMSGRNRGR